MLYIFNKLKKILLLFILIFLTGCEAEYNIEINNNVNLKEIINVIENDKALFNKKNSQLYNRTPKEYLETNLKWPTSVYKSGEINPYEPIKLDNTYYYTKTDISNYKQLGLSYSFNHNQKKYDESDLINKCYDIKYIKNNDTILLETISSFKCFDEYKLLDKVTINLNTTCKVNIENSDKNENNKYTWYITKENYDKKIKFEIECQNDNSSDKQQNTILILVVFGYLTIIFIMLFVVRILNIKNNKL